MTCLTCCRFGEPQRDQRPEVQTDLVGGFNQPLWKMQWVSNSWDDYSIPNWMESRKIPWFQSTNQWWSLCFVSHLCYPIFPYKERQNFHPWKWLMIHPLPISVEFDNWPTWPQRYAVLSPWYPKLCFGFLPIGIPKKIEKGLNQDFRKMFLSLNFQISSDFQLFSNFKLVVPKH